MLTVMPYFSAKDKARGKTISQKTRLAIESLEDRVLMDTALAQTGRFRKVARGRYTAKP